MTENNFPAMYVFLGTCLSLILLFKLFMLTRIRETRRSFSASLLEKGEGELTLTVQFFEGCPSARSSHPKCRECTKREPHRSQFTFNGGIGRVGWSDILSEFIVGDLPALWEKLCAESAEYDFYQIVFMSELATIMREHNMKPKTPKGLVLLTDNIVGRIWADG